MANEQAVSVPYSADVLQAHDSELVFQREFGTNVAPDIGDAFLTTVSGAAGAPSLAVNPRLGMLEINSFMTGMATAFNEPRGSTYLIPEWSTFPPSPFFGTTFIVIYAHLLLREVDNSQLVIDPAVDLMLAGDTLVGHAPAVEFALCSVDGTATTPADGPGLFQSSDWTNGPAGQGNDFDAPGWGRNAYYRILAVSDGVKMTDMEVWFSWDGLTWNNLQNVSLPNTVLRRIGISVRGFAIGALDWVRLYTMPNMTSLPGGGAWFVPPLPETGGRIFIP